jgi:S-adenosylmethionine decarboxylase
MTHCSSENIESLIYERKNELFPRSQVTSFEEDAKILNRYLPGQAYRFGAEDDHHIFLFHMNKPFTPPKDDKTLEFLMHGISEETSRFYSATNNKNEIRNITALSEFFPNFNIDDHIFEPVGYSLNACKDRYYFTIHVTPQKIGSYVSFETNYYTTEGITPLLNSLLEVFAPSSCDLLLFQNEPYKGLTSDSFRLKREVKQTLECGYNILFHHYYNIKNASTEAFKLKI